MNRKDFFEKLMRLALLAFLALIVFALGKRIVTSQDCSSCPGYGVCSGKADCNKY